MSDSNVKAGQVCYKTPRNVHDSKTLGPDNRLLYDVQQAPSQTTVPWHAVSESRLNDGPGFDSLQMRDQTIHQVATEIQDQYECKASEILLFQQRPDGNFDRVHFREIGRDGTPEADQERMADQSGWNSTEPQREKTAEITECGRELCTREHVEEKMGGALYAPAVTAQQRQAVVNEMNRPFAEAAVPTAAWRQERDKNQDNAKDLTSTRKPDTGHDL